jgi:hypothetical protein
MEDRLEVGLFTNLTRSEICEKLAAICQQSADGLTTSAADRRRMQTVANDLKNEAQSLVEAPLNA